MWQYYTMVIISGATIFFGFIAWAIIGGIINAISDGVDSIETHFLNKK